MEEDQHTWGYIIEIRQVKQLRPRQGERMSSPSSLPGHYPLQAVSPRKQWEDDESPAVCGDIWVIVHPGHTRVIAILYFQADSTGLKASAVESKSAKWPFDNLKHPISLNVTPCVTLKKSKGTLVLSYIPRRDIKDLRFNLKVSLNSMVFPMRQEVVCRGSDGVYSFCRALKGETVNTNVSFSYTALNFFKGQYTIVVEAVTGSHDDQLFCLNVTAIHESKFK
ncbi:lymphocyte antigen 96 [Echinops telfairi]|uniref:Lymphocyte antigen 96 n=1 Tax=Echinops telfairi TaxID=9371 RepID=A0ABM0IDU6_ECHTE|nr:lymphocyte antigen 96 [Echinops telfairi]